MRITEPTTAITDYILAVETLILGILLLRSGAHLPVKFWAISFFVLAAAAFTGGTFHGFIGSLDPLVAHVLWKITLLSVGIATFLMLSAAILRFSSVPMRTVLLAIAVLQFCVYLFFISRSNDFRIVIFDYVPAMILIVVLSYIAEAPSTPLILTGVLLSFVGAAIQSSGVKFHNNLNHNDIYHVIQMVGMYFFYRAGKLL